MPEELKEEHRFMANIDYVVEALQRAADLAEHPDMKQFLEDKVAAIRYDPIAASMETSTLPHILRAQQSNAQEDAKLFDALGTASFRMQQAADNLRALSQSPLADLVQVLGRIVNDLDEGGDYPELSGNVPHVVGQIRDRIKALPNEYSSGLDVMREVCEILNRETSVDLSSFTSRFTHVRKEIASAVAKALSQLDDDESEPPSSFSLPGPSEN